MGAPKLLLPLGGEPLIARTLAAWERSRMDRIIVVVHPSDQALINFLVPEHQPKIQNPKPKIELVIPEVPPADMKASVQAALRHIQQRYAPSEADAFLVAPADIPRLSCAIIDRLIEQHAAVLARTIIVPTIAGTRGHPVLMSWLLTGEVFDLQDDEGLKVIVERHQPMLVPCEDLVASGENPFADVDTKEDYQQLANDR
jgi:molybdenum cofactor cytidylyltransferase